MSLLPRLCSMIHERTPRPTSAQPINSAHGRRRASALRQRVGGAGAARVSTLASGVALVGVDMRSVLVYRARRGHASAQLWTRAAEWVTQERGDRAMKKARILVLFDHDVEPPANQDYARQLESSDEAEFDVA